MHMEENYSASPYKIGSNEFIHTSTFDTSIKIPDRPKVKYNLTIP